MRIFVHVNISKIRCSEINPLVVVVIFFIFAFAVSVCNDPPCIRTVCIDPPCIPAVCIDPPCIPAVAAVFAAPNAAPGTPCIPADVAHAPTAVATDFAGPNAAIAVICRRGMRLL